MLEPSLACDVHRWLRADVRLACGSPEHAHATRLATAAIAAYPLGMLVLNALLLSAARKSIYGDKPPTPLSEALTFLHADYTPLAYW